MWFDELFEGVIVEWGGSHGFSGFGQGLFGGGAYREVATWIAGEPDEDIRIALGEWFSKAFERDNPAFKPQLFMKWIMSGKTSPDRHYRFQQRHYWYFAELIKKHTDDPHLKAYLGRWLGDHLEGNRNAREDQAENKYYDSPEYARWGHEYVRNPMRRDLWDSAVEAEGSDPSMAENPHGAAKKSRGNGRRG